MAKIIDKTKKTKKTAKPAKKKNISKIVLKHKKFDEQTFNERLGTRYDELKWLYCELYQNNENALGFFEDLVKIIKESAQARADYLRSLDDARPADDKWYQKRDFVGMSIYPECFAGDFKSFSKRLPYLAESNIKYVHLASVFDEAGSVSKHLGGGKDLVKLLEDFHKEGIASCIDFALNGTGMENEWAVRSFHGEKTYQEKYWLFDSESSAGAYAEDGAYEITYLKNIEKYALTTCCQKQLELNYSNPSVFNGVAERLLSLANAGADIIGLKGISRLWKQPGETAAEMPQNHNILRMLRMICEIACPSAVLLGRVDAAPENAAAYFGTPEKGQCHIVCNAAISADLWHTAAAQDSALLKRDIDQAAALSNNNSAAALQNSLRSLDGISWNLDFDFLRNNNTDENLHKKYLNEFFEGKFDGSFALGELCRCSGKDRHMCGTSASLCGVEYYDRKKDKEGLMQAIDRDIMLHGVIFALPGVPVLCSGDEIAQYSDCDYKKNAHKKDNAHFMNKAVFNWRKAGRRNIEKAIQSRIYQALKKMELIKSQRAVFDAAAQVRTLDTWDKAVLAIMRETENEKFIGLYNFGSQVHTAWIDEDGEYVDLLNENSGRIKAQGIEMQPCQIMWLWREKA